MINNIATSSKRMIAFIIDCLINIFGIVIAILCANMVGSKNGIWVIFGFIIALAAIKMSFWYDGTTLGKSYLNLRIVDKNTGTKLRFLKMIFRQSLGMLVSSSILNLGFIWILIDREHQGWHDKMFNDIVIEEVDLPSGGKNEKDDYIQGY